MANQKHPFVDDKGEIDIAKILRVDYPASDIECSEGFKALPSNLMCEYNDRPRTSILTGTLANIQNLKMKTIKPIVDDRKDPGSRSIDKIIQITHYSEGGSYKFGVNDFARVLKTKDKK